MTKYFFALSLLIAQMLLIKSDLKAQTDYNSLIKGARAMIPNELGKADTVVTKLLEEIEERGLKNDSLFAKATFLKGMIQQYHGWLNIAAKYYLEVLQTAYSKQNEKLTGDCYNNLAIIYQHQSRYPEALQAYHRSLESAESLGDSTSIVETWMNIFLLDNYTGNYPTAIEGCKRTLDYFQRHLDTVNMAYCHGNLAMFYGSNHSDLVEYHMQEALRYFTAMHDTYNVVKCNIDIAEFYVKINQFIKARAVLLQTKEKCLQNDFKDVLETVYRLLAETEMGEGGDASLAEEYIERALSICKVQDLQQKMLKVLLVKTRLYAKSGNFPLFTAALDEYITLENTMSGNSSSRIYKEMQTIYEVEKKNSQNKLLKLENNRLAYKMKLLLLALLGATLATAIIAYQYFRINRDAKTMYKLNLSIANTKIHHTIETNLAEDNTMGNLFEAISWRIESEKLFLHQGFSIQNLCLLMNRSERYISKAIAEGGETNFSNLIRDFRVNEARRLLVDHTDLNLMSQVAEKSGFGTRQTFYKAFKIVTGFTPQEYVSWSIINRAVSMDDLVD